MALFSFSSRGGFLRAAIETPGVGSLVLPLHYLPRTVRLAAGGAVGLLRPVADGDGSWKMVQG